MDDEGATKLIAVIHRLANRIDSLDKITVEAAAIAHEGRRAAMDAADATSPKQTAKHLSTHIKPMIGKFDGEFRASMDNMNNIVGQLLEHAQTAGDTLKAAYGDAAFVAREHERRSRNLLIATGAIGFSVVAISLLSAWIFHDQLLRSRWGCELFGGIYKWGVSDGSFCIFGAR